MTGPKHGNINDLCVEQRLTGKEQYITEEKPIDRDFLKHPLTHFLTARKVNLNLASLLHETMTSLESS